MYTIRKKFKFEAAHVLDSSYSKDCQNIHGHSYILEVIVSGDRLNEDGMLFDFGELKNIINPILLEWDHAVIVSSSNKDTKEFLKKNKYKYFVMWNNPTAESMCRLLYEIIAEALDETFTKLVIRIHETETGYAEYTEGGI